MADKHYTRKQAAWLIRDLLDEVCETAGCRIGDHPYAHDPDATDDMHVFGSEIGPTLRTDGNVDTFFTAPDAQLYRITVQMVRPKAVRR